MRTTKETNTKNKIPKANKGITLIALVITIIVMLILVAVTITMAVNGGLFEYAGNAAGETQNAINAEQSLASGRVNVNGIWYDDIDAYINNVPSEVQDEEDDEPSTITFKLGNETYTVEEGTTWATWISSTEGTWTVAADGKIAQGTTKFIGYEGVAVASDAPIVAGREYVTIITFTIGDEGIFTAEEGMTWEAWIASTDYDSGDWKQYDTEVGRHRNDWSDDFLIDNDVEGEHVSYTSPIIAGKTYIVDTVEIPM